MLQMPMSGFLQTHHQHIKIKVLWSAAAYRALQNALFISPKAISTYRENIFNLYNIDTSSNTYYIRIWVYIAFTMRWYCIGVSLYQGVPMTNFLVLPHHNATQ